jgi:VanZ family protein
MHFLIRKCAHVAEYFIFSLLVLEAIRGGRGGWNRKWGIIAIAIAAAYAATDETHQLFVASRGASVVDVLIDTSGATLAQLAMAWWAGRHAGRNKGEPLVTAIKDSDATSTS